MIRNQPAQQGSYLILKHSLSLLVPFSLFLDQRSSPEGRWQMLPYVILKLKSRFGSHSIRRIDLKDQQCRMSHHNSKASNSGLHTHTLVIISLINISSTVSEEENMLLAVY